MYKQGRHHIYWITQQTSVIFEICCFTGDWDWWSSLGLSAGSNGWQTSSTL